MTRYSIPHTKTVTDRLHIARKKGVRGLTGYKHSITAEGSKTAGNVT